jgi:hypothetical protein
LHPEAWEVAQIDWSQRVGNLEALGDREKELWTKIAPILNEVLDELKGKGLIETIFVQKETEALWSSIVKQDVFSRVSNILLHLSDNVEKRSEFVKLNARFGLDEPSVVANYIMSALTLIVMKTELFKLVLLFNLKRGGQVSHAVSKFGTTMQGAAPETWPRLKPLVDNPLRNAIAHATYAFVGEKVVLFDDATLEPFEELDLGHIMMRMKDQDVLFQCLLYVLNEKSKADFFTPECDLSREGGRF